MNNSSKKTNLRICKSALHSTLNLKNLLVSLGFSFSAILAATAQAQSIPILNILDESGNEHFLPDYSFAGYNHGIGDIPTLKGRIIDVTRYGVTPNDNIDDSKAMLEALEAAHKVRGNVILKMPAGRIIISEILKIERGDIVLRGAGSGELGTELHFPRPLQMVDQTDYLDEIRRYLKKYDKKQREKIKI